METSKTDSIQHKQKSYHQVEAPHLIKNLSFPFSFLDDFYAWPDSFQEISLPFNWNLLLTQLWQTTLMQPWAFCATQKQTPVSWHGQIPCFSSGLWILSCTNGRWRVNDLLCCAFIFNQRQPCDCWLQSLVSSNWDDLIFFVPVHSDQTCWPSRKWIECQVIAHWQLLHPFWNAGAWCHWLT